MLQEKKISKATITTTLKQRRIFNEYTFTMNKFSSKKYFTTVDSVQNQTFSRKQSQPPLRAQEGLETAAPAARRPASKPAQSNLDHEGSHSRNFQRIERQELSHSCGRRLWRMPSVRHCKPFAPRNYVKIISMKRALRF